MRTFETTVTRLVSDGTATMFRAPDAHEATGRYYALPLDRLSGPAVVQVHVGDRVLVITDGSPERVVSATLLRSDT